MGFDLIELTWDSNFFGRKIGKIEISDCENIKFVEEAIADSNFETIYIFNNLSENRTESLCSSRSIFMDRKLILIKNSLARKNICDSIQVLSNRNDEDLLTLCLLSGHLSRFKKDSLLNHKFKDMYEKWLSNCFDKGMVLGYYEKNKLCGFVGIVHNRCDVSIELIAVSENSQKKGVGSKLLDAVEYFGAKDLRTKIVVATQFENISAVNLYEKNNYIKHQCIDIYHYHK